MSSSREVGFDPGDGITTPERRRDLDVARELVVFSLIFFHTMRIFDDMGFYVKNETIAPWLTGLVIFASIWGMPLLFTIAGYAWAIPWPAAPPPP